MGRRPKLKSRRQAGGANHHRRFNANTYLTIFVVLLLLSLVCIYSMFDANNIPAVPAHAVESFGATIGYPTTTTISNTNNNNNHKKALPSVDCPSQIAARNTPDNGDPNNGMAESPNRLTITDPPFWISVHKQWFDPMRWTSIINNGNYYETGITDQFHQILTQQPPGLVLDIGMNIGWFTLYSRAHGHRVVALEPNPIMHTRVCESLQLNGAWMSDGSVQIFPYGIGDRETTLNLTMGNNPGGSSFHQDRLAKKYRKQIPVPVVTLDRIAEQEGWLEDTDTATPPIHLMKVDVEGFEPQVFAGAHKLLFSGKVQNIIMENSVTDLRVVTDLFATLHQAGYQIKLVSTVNGDPYHPEMLPSLVEAVKSMTVGMDLAGVTKEIEFMAKVTCNVWWYQR